MTLLRRDAIKLSLLVKHPFTVVRPTQTFAFFEKKKFNSAGVDPYRFPPFYGNRSDFS